MDLGQLIKHPELMDKETLYDLRSLVALYPYHQAARLLMLQNLYIMHSPSFDEELRKAAIYFTDRKVIFKLVEAAHYKLRTQEDSATQKKYHTATDNESSRTISLIDKFLDTIPEDKEEKAENSKRKPTPADAAVDYVSYLLETESEEEKEEEQKNAPLKGHDLIDNFINNEGGKIELTEAPDNPPEFESDKTEEKEGDEGVFTETLARIYIKQGQYSKALEIIKRINLNYPKKNVYFADQIRFLEKLIINNKYK